MQWINFPATGGGSLSLKLLDYTRIPCIGVGNDSFYALYAVLDG